MRRLAGLATYAAIAAGALSACSGGSDGSSCSVSEADGGGAVIECEDGSSVVIEGPGEGMDGTGCTVEKADGGGAIVICDDGTMVTIPPGPEGPGGPAGDAGPPGSSGLSFGVAGVGLNTTIETTEIDEDRYPVVTVVLADSNEVGLDVTGKRSSGAFSVQFTVAKVPVADDGEAGPYINYLIDPETDQPSRDDEGEWTLIDATEGRWEYKFAKPLPEDEYEDALTHVVSIAARRDMPEGVNYVANDTYFFVPADDEAKPLKREVTATSTCNNCHDHLAAHGGRREEVQLCLTCHTQGAIDPETGNSIDFAQMLHKIHRGADLPSVENGEPYFFVGYMGHEVDFSEINFPRDIRNCASCHTGANADWLDTRPSAEACGSCHDDVWFGPTADKPDKDWVVNHPGGPKDNDTCTNCHASAMPFPQCKEKPSGGKGCDSYSVHYNEFTDPDAVKLVAEGLKMEVAAADQAPVVSFRIRKGTNGDDGLTDVTDPDELSDLRIVLAGPNEDYANTERVQPDTSPLTHEGGGVFSTTLGDTYANLLASSGLDPAVDSITLSLRIATTINPGEVNEYKAYVINPTAAFSLNPDPDALVERRVVVTNERCNNCHEDMGYTHHRGSYRSVEQCNMCHLPISRPSAPPRLGPMIHDAHANEVPFPGDPRNCETCHEPGTYSAALPDGILPTAFGTVDELAATTSFCTGCHSAPATLDHAMLNTTGTGDEACVTCHGDGKSFGVDVVHARPEYE